MNSFSDLISNSALFNVPDAGTFAQHALILLVLAQLLAYVYRVFGQTLSNKERLSALFPVLALTTMMIISIIKSSIALSLGLVGALSIVRFRSAIKEPEELAYIFLTISLGLGMGAGQIGLTLIFYAVIMVFIIARGVLHGRIRLPGIHRGNLYYVHLSSAEAKLDAGEIESRIKKHAHVVVLKRLDTHAKKTTAFFTVQLKRTTSPQQLIAAIQDTKLAIEVSVVAADTEQVLE